VNADLQYRFGGPAAIVLSDLAVVSVLRRRRCGEGHRQKRPWFILAVMLFSYCVRALYISRCHVRARGVFAWSKRPWAGKLAKFSVSALYSIMC